MRVNYEGQATNRFRAGGSALLVRSLQRLGRGRRALQRSTRRHAAQRAVRLARQHRLQADAGRAARQPTVRHRQLEERQPPHPRLRTLFATYNLAEGLDYRVNFGPDLTFNRNGHVPRRADAGASRARARRIDARPEDLRLSRSTTSCHVQERSSAARTRSMRRSCTPSKSRASRRSSRRRRTCPYESAQLLQPRRRLLVSGISSQISQWALQSYMARMNYTLLDKYLLTLTAASTARPVWPRETSSPRFPSVALGWRVIDDAAGEQHRPPQQLQAPRYVRHHGQHVGRSLPDAGLAHRTPYACGATAAFGYQPGTLSNPELRWEKTATIDAGRRLRDQGRPRLRHHRLLCGEHDRPAARSRAAAVHRLFVDHAERRRDAQHRHRARSLGSDARELAWRPLDERRHVRQEQERDRDAQRRQGRRSATSGSSASRSTAAATRCGATTSSSASGRRPTRRWRDRSAASLVKSASRTSTATASSAPTTRSSSATPTPMWTGAFSSRVDYRGVDLSVQAITRQNFMIRNDLIRGATLAGRYNSPTRTSGRRPIRATPRHARTKTRKTRTSSSRAAIRTDRS